MAIKITLRQLVESEQSLQQFSQYVWPGALVKVSYWLSKTWNGAQHEMRDYQKQKVELVKQFGEEVKDRAEWWQVKADAESQRQFNEAHNELLSVSVELPGSTITLAQLEQASLALSPAMMATLDWLIVNEEQPAGQAAAAAA